MIRQLVDTHTDAANAIAAAKTPTVDLVLCSAHAARIFAERAAKRTEFAPADPSCGHGAALWLTV